MIKFLLKLFIFFAPFTSFFALSAWMRLPVVINQLLIVVLTIGILKQFKVSLKFLKKEDIFLLIFLCFVWLSFIMGFRERRSFNHALAYTNAIILFFIITKFVFHYLEIKSIEIAKVIYLSFLTITAIILIDFIGKNYLDSSLRELFSEADGKISNMNYYIRAGLFRVGGVSEEPGHMAHFYNIYFGISLYYLHKIRKNKIKLVLLFLIAHFTMFSNAGIALTMIIFSFGYILEKIESGKISTKQLLIAIILALLVIVLFSIIYFFDIVNYQDIINEFFSKLFFNESEKSYSSSGQRLIQWERAIQNFIKHPIFGNGAGFGVHQDSEGYLSLYLTILSDIGIIGFIFFIGFLEIIIKKALNLSKEFRYFILFSIGTSLLHLIIISEFYHAPIWILFSFIQLLYSESKSENTI